MGPVPRVRGGLAFALSASLLLPASALGSAVTFLDEFIITRSLTPTAGSASLGTYEGAGIFYRDSFDDGLEPPSGGSFFGPNPGNYFTSGSYGATDESGNKLRLDSSMGTVGTNAAGQGRRNQQSILNSNIDPANSVQGLKQAFHTFSIYGRFDLALPPQPVDSYRIFLQDSGGGLFNTEDLGVGVQRLEDGSVVVRFVRQDFVAGTLVVLDEDLLTFPAGADQIELRLQRASLSDDLVSAAYRFWDDGAPVTPFTVMDGATEFFNTRPWGRAGFRAFEALVPEPGTLALLLSGLGLLAFFGRRRQFACSKQRYRERAAAPDSVP